MQKIRKKSTTALIEGDTASIKRAQHYASVHRKDFEEMLSEFLRIPSISAQTNHSNDIRRGANYVKKMLVTAGLHNVTVSDPASIASAGSSAGKTKQSSGQKSQKNKIATHTKGVIQGHPIVTGEYWVGHDRPTVLIYGHYDVQPVDPIGLWKTDPFEPVIKNNRIYARGASDDKGQLSIHIKALESILRREKTLPVNVKVLIEGEEEISSPSLLPYIKQNKNWLRSDIVLISDTEMAGTGQPAITYSLRGIVYLEVEITTGNRDVHSGIYGGAALNASEILMKALTMLKDMQTNRIHIADFYRDVKPISSVEKREMRDLSRNEPLFKKELGLKYFGYEKPSGKNIADKGKYLFLERTTAMPSLEISGFTAGYTGLGAKTIVPSTASAKIGIRLLSDQNPRHINTCLRRQLRANLEKLVPGGFSNITVRFKDLGLGSPVCVDRNSSYMQAGLSALTAEYGCKAVLLRSGGSIPIVADFVKILGVEPILMGFGHKQDAVHSPNESFSLEDFHKGILTSIRYLYSLAGK